MTLKGWSLPLSPAGTAALVPPPPWHFSGEALGIDFLADPAAVAAVLPDGLEPLGDGSCSFVFCDWSSAADSRPPRDRRSGPGPVPRGLPVGQRHPRRPQGRPGPLHLGRQRPLLRPRPHPGLPQEDGNRRHHPSRARRPRRPEGRGRRPLRRSRQQPRPRSWCTARSPSRPRPRTASSPGPCGSRCGTPATSPTSPAARPSSTTWPATSSPASRSPTCGTAPASSNCSTPSSRSTPRSPRSRSPAASACAVAFTITGAEVRE